MSERHNKATQYRRQGSNPPQLRPHKDEEDSEDGRAKHALTSKVPCRGWTRLIGQFASAGSRQMGARQACQQTFAIDEHIQTQVLRTFVR